MIALAPLFVWWVTAAAAAPIEVRDLDRAVQSPPGGVESIDSEIDQTRAARDENQAQIRTVASRLHAVEGELNERRAQVADLDQATGALATEVTLLHERLATTTGALGQERQLLAARLRQLHEQGDPPPAVALLTTRVDPWALLLDRRYQEAVAAASGERLDRLTTQAGQLEAMRQEFAARQLRLDEERHALTRARAELAEKVAEQTALLAESQRQDQTLAARIAALEGDRQRLTAMVDQLATRPTPAARHGEIATAQGHLPWPVRGDVTAFFGTVAKGGGPPATGIRIQPAARGEVRAVWDGEVLFADWFEGYGLLLIVDHGSGYYSLYGHTSGLRVAAGDPIHQGDAIADTADPDAEPLYFEIRQDGQPLDPLRWLEGLAAVATTTD